MVLNFNQTSNLSATVYDQFGLALTAQPSFTWSKVSGVGSVNNGGVYSAGTSAGSATISAASGGISGTASITVGNAAPTVATPASAGASTVTGTSTTRFGAGGR